MSACACGMGRRCDDDEGASSKKGGAARPLFLRERAYRFLPAFFFPPLAAFFAIALIPPFTVGFRVRRASTAGLSFTAPVALCRNSRVSGRSAPKKLGVSLLDTPQ